jgi:ankyrin repeat protein
MAAAGSRASTATLLALLAAGARATRTTHFSWTALHEAARRGRADAVAVLLDAGAHVNAVSHDGRTPLACAAGRGAAAAVRELLARGANALGGGRGASALERAAWVGSLPVIRAILTFGGFTVFSAPPGSDDAVADDTAVDDAAAFVFDCAA